MTDKRKRVKNPNPVVPAEPVRHRIKAGSPGSPVALPGDPEGPEEKKAPAKKAAAPEKK